MMCEEQSQRIVLQNWNTLWLSTLQENDSYGMLHIVLTRLGVSTATATKVSVLMATALLTSATRVGTYDRFSSQ
jgi:hypothetical protein